MQFSTRRRVAVLSAVDQVEYRDHENVETSGQNDVYLTAIINFFFRNRMILGRRVSGYRERRFQKRFVDEEIE